MSEELDVIQKEALEEGAQESKPRAAGSDLARRELLQLGMLGVAGSLAGGVSAKAAVAAPRSPIVGERGTGTPTDGSKCPPPKAEAAAVVPGAPETWNEPWVWRPSEWPGQQLDLNAVENQNPGIAVGLGNPGSVLFSYGGQTPGPTIRMKGDETLRVKLRNLFGQDFGQTFVGPFPKVSDAPKGSAVSAVAETKAKKLGNDRQDFCLGEHTNGVHSIRVTNLHTHGLHVRPSRNPDGTHSDNVILRVMSQADFNRREREGAAAECAFMRSPQELYALRDDETVGEADYEFRLGDVQSRKRARENRKRARQGKPQLPPQSHPAGTFWYHPHSHGATHNQVASGMAGFLVVEGDIEEAVNRVLTDWKVGDPVPDPSIKTAPYDYRERLMLMQRAHNLSADKDASKESPGLSAAAAFQPLVNGGSSPTVITMRPGAVERWRVLNGSVDGRGYKRFMVVKGQYTIQKGANGNFDTYEVDSNGDLEGPITLAGLEAFEKRKQDLHQLSVDGVTLIKRKQAGGVKYHVKDLSRQNADQPNPLWSPDRACLERLKAWIKKQKYAPSKRAIARQGADLYCRLVNVWKDERSVKNCFVRPNEFYMGPANRTDVFFQAPTQLGRSYTRDGKATKYEIYTVMAKTVIVHSDTPMVNAQNAITTGVQQKAPEDVIVAWILVEEDTGNPGSIKPASMKSLMKELEQALPLVQDYLQPIGDEELVVTDDEIKARPGELKSGDYRTRRILYSGWGHPNMPLVSTYPLRIDDKPRRKDPPTARAFVDFIRKDQKKNDGKLENLSYTEYPAGSGYYVLLAPDLRTMAISFDNPRTDKERPKDADRRQRPWSHPHAPRKFDPTDPYRARMLENTAEEWTLYNLTNPLFGNTNVDPQKAIQSADPREPGYKQPITQYNGHFVSYPISRREGTRLFLENPEFQLTARGIDHPFHIHQNPFWVSRIEIPDQDGNLCNILDEPRWMDSIWIPRNRGRVVFRMRFPDYVGAYVHHCHILLHEDNGMMQVIEATPFANESNFNPRPAPGPAPRPTPEESYTLSSTFVDPDPVTGQVYPGFEVKPPRLDG